MKKITPDQYHPLYFLASLGAGGLAVTFFLYFMFLIVFGLVHNGLVERFSPVFFLLMLPLVWVQLKGLTTLLRLNRKLLRKPGAALAMA